MYTKRDARKKKKEEPLRKEYQKYLSGLKKRGKAAHKRALTWAQWKNANTRTRAAHKQAERYGTAIPR